MRDFDINKKISIDLDVAEATLLVSILTMHIEEMTQDMSMEGLCKYFMLKKIGDNLIDQIVPPEQYADFVKEAFNSKTLLEALKHERETKKEQ